MRFNILYLVLVTLWITACHKAQIVDSSITSQTSLQAFMLGDESGNEKDGKDDKGKEACFELVYPLTVTMPDGSLLSGDKEDLWIAVKAWYEANQNSKDKPILNYPLEVQFKEGISKIIDNENELEATKKYCEGYKDKEEKEDCFDLIYPVTWTMPEGNLITMNNNKDWDDIDEWYKDNPKSKEKPSLNYPVDIEFKDGITQTINNEDEMEIAKKDCD